MASTFSIDLSDKDERFLQFYIDATPNLVGAGLTPKQLAKQWARTTVDGLIRDARVLNKAALQDAIDAAMEKLTLAEAKTALANAAAAKP